jgi:uncharacterized protein YccT (UPF0319 family)
METSLVKTLLDFLTQGGSSAVIVVISCVIALLIWDRKSLIKSLEKNQDKLVTVQNQVVEAKEKEIQTIKEIIEKYHNGTLTTIQALNEIKIVLTTIQNSVR